MILVLISISCVSATETNQTPDISKLYSTNIDSNDFTNLESEINSSLETKLIEVNKDYTYNEITDTKYIDGITINTDNFVIDGKGHTIDASGKSRAFVINSNNVVLKNIKIINGISDSNGGAINWKGDNGTIINSTFNYCISPTNGGAVYFKSTGNVINSTFEYNNATFGGSICFDGEANVINSRLTNNHAVFLGGAISFYEFGSVKNVTFSKNVAGDGSGIYASSDCNVDDSTFIQNYAIGYGAITSDRNLKVINSTFIKNLAKYSSAIFLKNDGQIEKCNFTQNSAESYGIILATGNVISITNSEFNHNQVNDVKSLYIQTKEVTINNSTFNNYNSTLDSEIHIESNKKILHDLSFYNAPKVDIKDDENMITNNTPPNKTDETKKPSTSVKNVKKSTYITAKAKTFKLKTKTKKYTVILKSGKNVLKNKKVILKIKGKRYSAKTNSKGKATFKIKLSKKGKYKTVITFGGDKLYKSSKKSVHIKIKK